MKIVILTEGTAQTGYGHLSRCLAIYHGFEEHGITPIFIADCDNNGANILHEVKVRKIDWVFDMEELGSTLDKSDIVILDSYRADITIYQRIQKMAEKAVYLDDTMRLQYPSGVIINGAIGANKIGYSSNQKHKLLLGGKYTPLRKPFWDVPHLEEPENFKSVLISMGSYDSPRVSIQILNKLLDELPQLKYDVIVGINNLDQLPNNMISDRIVFHNSVGGSQIRTLMMESDIIITAGGQTLYESLRFQRPKIVVGTADNQMNSLINLCSEGYIKDFLVVDDAEFTNKIVSRTRDIVYKQINIVHKLISGSGVRNIVQELLRN